MTTEAATAIEMLHNVNKHAFGQNLEAELASEAAYEAVASKIHSHCNLHTCIAHCVHTSKHFHCEKYTLSLSNSVNTSIQHCCYRAKWNIVQNNPNTLT